MRHGDIWRGLDELAARHGLSTSGLAKRAGLDATAFNKSKRTAKDGRPRWPSTESLALVLAAVESDLTEFAAIVGEPARAGLPCLDLDQALGKSALDENGVLDQGCERKARLDADSLAGDAFILEVSSDALAPVYRAGDRLMVSPRAPIHVGDRGLLKTSAGELLIAERQEADAEPSAMVWQALSGDQGPEIEADIVWASRILWLGQ